MRTGAGQGISGFDPTGGADPIFATAGRSEEQQQSQQASSQVAHAASFHPVVPCAMHLVVCTYGIICANEVASGR